MKARHNLFLCYSMRNIPLQPDHLYASKKRFSLSTHSSKILSEEESTCSKTQEVLTLSFGAELPVPGHRSFCHMENPQEKCIGPWKYLWPIYHMQGNKLGSLIDQPQVLASRACSLLRKPTVLLAALLSFEESDLSSLFINMFLSPLCTYCEGHHKSVNYVLVLDTLHKQKAGSTHQGNVCISMLLPCCFDYYSF